MSDRNRAILYSGGHKGTEAEFGRCAERWGVRQVTLSYDGHVMEYSKDVQVLSPEELLKGDVSMEIVSKRMGRTYTKVEQIRTVCQLIFHMVSRSYSVFAVGWIQGDDTVQGGTGWGVELAKFFNRPVNVSTRRATAGSPGGTATGRSARRPSPSGPSPPPARGTSTTRGAGRSRGSSSVRSAPRSRGLPAELLLQEVDRPAPGEVGGLLAVARGVRVVVEGVVRAHDGEPPSAHYT